MNIILTDTLRALPFFSHFTEESVDVPAKPFLRELLEGTICLEKLGLEELFACVETSIYFNLDTLSLLREVLWQVGETKETFQRWCKPLERRDWRENQYFTWSDRLPNLVRLELIKTFGERLDEDRLNTLGFRHLNYAIYSILKGGNLRLLIWAHQGGEVLDDETEWLCREAAGNGSLECLKYLHEQGCPWDEVTCYRSTRHGRLDCLKYLHEQGCPWDESTCHGAAESGQLECLKYAHENGCPWDEETLELAVREGQLECLRYACEQGCAADKGKFKKVCTAAAAEGKLDCLRYLHEQGFPWDEKMIEAIWDNFSEMCAGLEEAALDVIKREISACINYIREQEPEWDWDELEEFREYRLGEPLESEDEEEPLDSEDEEEDED